MNLFVYGLELEPPIGYYSPDTNIPYKKQLRVYKPAFLNCEVCSKPVQNYEQCIIPYTYCCYDCYSILCLSAKNDYLDVKDLKRVNSEENLMKLDDENQIFCIICGTIHSEKDRRWCEAVDAYERQQSFGSV